MKKELLKQLENAAGFKIEEVSVVKNGVLKEGFRVKVNEEINPVIYLPESLPEEEIIPYFLNVLEEVKQHLEEVKRGYSKMETQSRQDILSGLLIGLQREGDEDLVKRPVPQMPGVEQYLYFVLSENENGRSRTKNVQGLLEKYHISEEEAWSHAFKNLSEQAVYRSLSDVLKDMGASNLPGEENIPMYVFSVKSSLNGAAAILCTNILKDLSVELGGVQEFAVLPSSIHEVLVTPYDGEDENILSSFTQMVKEANQEVVLPEEQLSDRAYRIHI